jgi:CheY-like chemotaxis protein
MLRIYGLTRSDILEARGVTVRVEEADSFIHLAVRFQYLADADRALLTTVLEGRERKSGPAGAPGPADRTDRVTAADLAEAPQDPETPEAPEPEAQPLAEDAGGEQLRALDRRTARILVVAAPGEAEPILRHLQAEGFWRLETAADPAGALEVFQQAAASPFRLLVADLAPTCAAGLETVGAVRQLEQAFGAFGGLPMAFITGKADPLLDLLDKPGLGVVARDDPDATRCGRVLDRLLSIQSRSQ